MLKREDGRVDWSRPAEEIRNRIHGCNPSPGAYTHRAGTLLKLWRAEVVPGDAGAAPGTVLDTRGPVVAAGSGAVRLLEVQPENRPRSSGEAFSNGYRLEAGERWGDDR
ncbi:MAG: methionyl-tRNA formyltransferase [Armatimonadota bacterium]